MIDAARQPAFVAVGQFDGYFKDHPDEADALRGIQAPLGAYTRSNFGLDLGEHGQGIGGRDLQPATVLVRPD